MKITKHAENLLYMGVIVTTSSLVFLHNAFPLTEIEPIECYNSTRFIVYSYSRNFILLVVWFLFYIHARGKEYRFIIWHPIIIITYQYVVYMSTLRATFLNDFNTKLLLSTLLIVAAGLHYFNIKRKQRRERKYAS